MKCPHCSKAIYFEETSSSAYEYEESEGPDIPGVDAYDIAHGFCPACNELIVMLREGEFCETEFGGHLDLENIKTTKILYPRSSNRSLELEVPEKYKEDFKEAVGVLNISPKASAAISRRLLQQILREEVGIKPSSLSKEIDDFISKNDVPTYLSNAVDAIRNVGNFAAHPLKDSNTGEIVDVEHGEAEWLLEVLESMFDFVFVQPKRLEEKREQLNKKLAGLGKQPMKGA